MPKSISAKKRARQAIKSRRKNMSVKSKIGSVRRKALEVLSATDLEAAKKVYREYCSTLDKAVKQGVVPKNTAVRRKRRAAARLAKLQAGPAKPAAT